MESNLTVKLATSMEMIGGRTPSKPVILAMIDQLDKFPADKVSVALDRCVNECRGHLALSDIISRIDDGRPDPNTAWSLVPRSEDDSILWTPEIAAAWRETKQCIEEGDLTGGRMAFIECYKRLVAMAKAKGIPVKWEFSAGFDKGKRVAALEKAYNQKLLPVESILKKLPYNDSGDQLRNKIEREYYQIEGEEQTAGLLGSFTGSLVDGMSLENANK